MSSKNIFTDNMTLLCSRFSVSYRTLKRILDYGVKVKIKEFNLSYTCQSKVLKVKLITGTDASSLPKEIDPRQLEIMNYLNNRIKQYGKMGFHVNSINAYKLINKRLSEGYSVDNFKDVIDIKIKHWIEDPERHIYVRPATLFGNKFEDYLNQVQEPLKTKKNDKFNEAAYRAANDSY
jgi:uncharacterized phage protein (TIGR02220 family)